MVTVAVIYGVSYARLKKLQGPLASLDVAVHVQYRLGRCRLAANNVAFSDSHATTAKYKAQLKVELQYLQQEYDTLIFGGPMRLMVSSETVCGLYHVATSSSQNTQWSGAIRRHRLLLLSRRRF